MRDFRAAKIVHNAFNSVVDSTPDVEGPKMGIWHSSIDRIAIRVVSIWGINVHDIVLEKSES